MNRTDDAFISDAAEELFRSLIDEKYEYCEALKACRAYIAEHLKPSRIRHIEGVCLEAAELADIYGEDKRKAFTAALFHDICKHMDTPELDLLVIKYDLDREFYGNKNLSHGPVAACLAKHEFGIDDDDILNAITYHTVARAGMSMLEKIIYTADAIEPGRTYPEASKLREKARTDLDGVFRFIIEWSIEDLARKGRPSSKYTLAAMEELKEGVKQVT